MRRHKLRLKADICQLLWPKNLEGVTRNGGFYDPVRYRDWAYPKVARNKYEDQDRGSSSFEETGGAENRPLLQDDVEMNAISHLPANSLSVQKAEVDADDEWDDLPARRFGPEYLCFLTDGPEGYETWKVSDWIMHHGEDTDTEFVFLSYTRRQFGDNAHPTLIHYGIEAARSAGKRAFWVDVECIRDFDNDTEGVSQSRDVYSICDIVRAAHSMVILLGPSISAITASSPQRTHVYSPEAMESWLREWGTRVWTLPEILLCSSDHPVKLYAIGGPSPPVQLAKRNFAARAIWQDAKRVRQLVDHYESSIHLTPLELVSIALECFAGRQTDQRNAGDMAYALMGLLRRRPAIDRSDSSFEAFARLSLANDSDALLERLICMQPVRPDAPWHEIKDAWGARLWDIEPRCQIAGIVDDETVTLDNAFGATIQWDAMEQVPFFKRPTLSRLVAKIVLRGAPAYLILGLVFTILGGVIQSYSDSYYYSDESSLSAANIAFLAIGLVILVPSFIITMLAPPMLLNIYGGKFWSTQALFIGIEGVPSDLGWIERHLFGFNYGRLKWSPAGSTLSRHTLSADGNCVALPPSQGQHHSQGGGEQQGLFTLIDTYAMTATAFQASRPPSTIMVCGHEGGMQRAILCSYDFERGTFAREAVVRVKTIVLDRMFRVDRFRFALRRRGVSEPTK